MVKLQELALHSLEALTYRIIFMNFGKEIVMLQSEREKYIKAMDFVRAREIENHINQLRAGSANAAVEDKSRSKKSNFEFEKHCALNELMQTASTLTKRIYQIRAKHQQDLIVVQARHAKEMTDLSAEYAKELELVSMRPVPQAAIIERDAQNQAKMSHYAMAQCLRKEAENVKQQALLLYQDELNKRYTDKQEKMLKRQQEFMKSFESKLATDIQQVHLDYRAAVSVAKRRISTTAIKNGLRVTDAELEGMIQMYPLVDDEVAPPSPSPKHVGPPSPRLYNPKGLPYSLSSSTSQASEVTPKKSRRRTPTSK